MDDRARNTLLMIVVVIALGYIGWQVRTSTESVTKSSDSVANLTDILNRRSPVLEYIACKDQATDAFSIAQADLVLAAFQRDEQGVVNASERYRIARDALARSSKSKEDGGCGAVPLPDG